VAGLFFEDGSLAVCWFADPGVLRLRRYKADGAADPAIDLAKIDTSRASGFPTMAGDGRRAIVSWTDLPGRTIRTIELRLVR